MDTSITAVYNALTPPLNSTTISPLLAGLPSGIPSRRGWPIRHCRRAHWYRFHLLGIHQRIQQQTFFGPERKGDSDNKLWSQHEIDTFNNILEQLRDLYNNRFEEYKKMIAQEKGYEYIPSDKVNKFILK